MYDFQDFPYLSHFSVACLSEKVTHLLFHIIPFLHFNPLDLLFCLYPFCSFSFTLFFCIAFICFLTLCHTRFFPFIQPLSFSSSHILGFTNPLLFLFLCSLFPFLSNSFFLSPNFLFSFSFLFILFSSSQTFPSSYRPLDHFFSLFHPIYLLSNQAFSFFSLSSLVILFSLPSFALHVHF